MNIALNHVMIDQNHRKHYDDDFKRKAVLYFENNHTSLADAADEFGITSAMLYKWTQAYSIKSHVEQTSDVTSENQISALRAEVAALKEDMGILREIISKAFLKKHLNE